MPPKSSKQKRAEAMNAGREAEKPKQETAHAKDSAEQTDGAEQEAAQNPEDPHERSDAEGVAERGQGGHGASSSSTARRQDASGSSTHMAQTPTPAGDNRGRGRITAPVLTPDFTPGVHSTRAEEPEEGGSVGRGGSMRPLVIPFDQDPVSRWASSKAAATSYADGPVKRIDVPLSGVSLEQPGLIQLMGIAMAACQHAVDQLQMPRGSAGAGVSSDEREDDLLEYQLLSSDLGVMKVRLQEFEAKCKGLDREPPELSISESNYKKFVWAPRQSLTMTQACSRAAVHSGRDAPRVAQGSKCTPPPDPQLQGFNEAVCAVMDHAMPGPQCIEAPAIVPEQLLGYSVQAFFVAARRNHRRPPILSKPEWALRRKNVSDINADYELSGEWAQLRAAQANPAPLVPTALEEEPHLDPTLDEDDEDEIEDLT